MTAKVPWESLIRATSLAVVLVLLLSLLGATALAGSPPGTDAEQMGPSDVTLASIAPVVVESGFISLSVDGAGTNNVTGALVYVDKPAGATVRSAYAAAASAGFSGRMLVDGDVKLDGTDVAWDISTASTINSWNHWADVTGLVKPTIDAAAPGLVSFLVAEVSPTGIDGVILAVIFDDPNQTVSNTVILLFGAQDVLGDTFNIFLANPLNKSDPNLVIDMGLGISFGFQNPSSTGQVSLVDVNGQRLTSSAGGQDDGESANGTLITVGGIGDSNDNPPPFAPPTNFDDPDDEMYDLLPFVQTGDTVITVYTINPSNDDNIFFAWLYLQSVTADVEPPTRVAVGGTAHLISKSAMLTLWIGLFALVTCAGFLVLRRRRA